MISDVFISDGKVYFSITVPAERAKELEPLRLAAERVIKEMPGVKGALVALTADKKAAASEERATASEQKAKDANDALAKLAAKEDERGMVLRTSVTRIDARGGAARASGCGERRPVLPIDLTSENRWGYDRGHRRTSTSRLASVLALPSDGT